MKRIDLNLGDYFYYDETSPSCLRWKVKTCSGHGRVMSVEGGIAGTAHNKAGYAVVGLYGVSWLVHKVIWCILNSERYGSFQIDHENGDVKNNFKSNLRKITQRANMQNRKLSSANTSGTAGVDKITSKGRAYWRARCYLSELAKCGKRGKEMTKSFSVNALGDTAAFNAACEWRKQVLEEINLHGGDYTERHGV